MLVALLIDVRGEQLEANVDDFVVDRFQRSLKLSEFGSLVSGTWTAPLESLSSLRFRSQTLFNPCVNLREVITGSF